MTWKQILEALKCLNEEQLSHSATIVFEEDGLITEAFPVDGLDFTDSETLDGMGILDPDLPVAVVYSY